MSGLVVNGRAVRLAIEGRTHLADVLREQLLLTGTHTGCEHGVCGACTVLLDDEPVRACITWPALLDGGEVRTIEGLEDDAIVIRLREAFSAEHALQCGYCTPGMLVTARDIVRRLPEADDDRVRLELAGNLCRCTGYNGIVRAIRLVLDERLELPPRMAAAVPAVRFGGETSAERDGSEVEYQGAFHPTNGLHPRLAFAVPAAELWAALGDPGLIAGCIPGAVLTAVTDGAIEGEMQVALGPVRVRFGGKAVVTYDQVGRSGVVQGGGNDQASGTRVTAEAAFRVLENGAEASVLVVDVSYGLRGALSQLAKPRVVELVAGEMAGAFGAALAARLRGDAVVAPVPLSGFGLLRRVVWGWVLGLFRA